MRKGAGKMKDKPLSVYGKIDRIVSQSVKYVSYLGAVSLMIVALIATADAIATKVFGSPIRNVTEFVTYMNIPVVFFCIGFVQLDHGHTHIDLIYKHFPKAVHTVIHMIGYVIGVAVCGFAGWRGIALTIQKFESMTYASGPTSFLIWPFVVCIGVGYLVLAISFLWCIVREWNGDSPYVIDQGGGQNAGKGE